MGPVIDVPPQIPVACLVEAARDYQLPTVLLLAQIKVESDGKCVVGHNKDGSKDYCLSQVNSRWWAPNLKAWYGVSLEALKSNPCQSVRAHAYIVRFEANERVCAGDIWCGVGHYHSRDPNLIRPYVGKVWENYQRMLQTGKF